uniref:Putative nuclease HARBI1 n=1 Tax=Anopheles coluzzii TaxID=1518534 RepID=A0A6E8W767_ANOCL|nr:putative nuclease HARBI1 [Anopheles coluzzii]
MDNSTVSEMPAASEEISDETVRELLGMSEEDFNYLLNEISGKISRRDTFMRKAFTAKERLIVTLRFLATGESFMALASLYDISASSIRTIIPEVCECLIKSLKRYVQFPPSETGWLRVSEAFQDRWQFPHAIGVIDARHVKIRKPLHTDKDYLNYKGFYSIVLLAVVDASANFMYVCVGGKGSIADGGMLRNASYHSKFEHHELNVPPPAVLDERHAVKIPYMLLGDKSFLFTEYCIRPFGGHLKPDSPESTFNYRMSQARTPAAVAFDGLCSRFKIFGTIINLQPDKAGKVVMAAVYLFNFLRRKNTTEETLGCGKGVPDSSYILPRLQSKPIKPASRLANIRLQIANYMMENGCLE